MGETGRRQFCAIAPREPLMSVAGRCAGRIGRVSERDLLAMEQFINIHAGPRPERGRCVSRCHEDAGENSVMGVP